MRKYIKYILLTLFVNLAACTGPLEEELYSNPGIDDFYKSAADAELAIAGVYAVLLTEQGIYKDIAYFIMGDFTTDIMQNRNGNNVPDEWASFTWNESTQLFDFMWAGSYLGINRANTLIDKLEAGNLSDAIKNEYIGQAKFLRALLYFNLVKAFGGVPLHTKGTFDASNVALPRNTEAETYQQIIDDLKDAEIRLAPFNPTHQKAGKATLGSAKGLLAKVYLQMRDWDAAAAKAKEVMDMGVYELYKDYKDIWNPDPSMENGSEHLFSAQHINGGDNTTNLGNHTVFRFTPQSQKHPVSNIDLRWSSEGGSSMGEVVQEFFDAAPDTYRKWWSMRDRMPFYWKTSNGEFVTGDTVQLIQPLVIKHYQIDLGTGYLQTGLNTTILRFSDILLTYAEAVNEDVGATAEAYEALNKVRRRARAVGTPFEQPEEVYPDIEPGTLTKEEFRDAILFERAQEFIGEGERRNDLNRHDRFLQTARDRGRNAPDGYELFPIHFGHILQNPLIEQNNPY
jgi:hypothetical protein